MSNKLGLDKKSHLCYNYLTMQRQIERYIEVLKDRKQLSDDNDLSFFPFRSTSYYTAKADLLDDIIAELEGLVKAQEHAEFMRQALMEAYGPTEEGWLVGYRNWEAGK